MADLNWYQRLISGLLQPGGEAASPDRYNILRRNIIVLMLLVTIVPLILMAAINHYQYRVTIKNEIVNPLRLLSNKTKHSFELFLDQRLANLRFIASAYSYEELADEKNLNRIFRILKGEFGGFVDLGLIDCKGIQISYAGPYDLLGKDYSQQSWFQEVAVRGVYISDVFMGYRKFPHIAIAVQLFNEERGCWILRATFDTDIFDNLIASMGLNPQSDAFLINHKGIFQTSSKFYGKVLEPCPFSPPPGKYGSLLTEGTDSGGREILTIYTLLEKPNYTLVVVKPRSTLLKTWFTLKSEMFFIFFTSVILIIMVVFKLVGVLVKNMREADEKREFAFRELEHSQKLSSIGRLAAGVAHEINNPMAIINEKAGLMKDLVEYDKQFEKKEKFLELTDSIIQSVERCKTITHRLLGFARRMEVKFEMLAVNELIKEVLGFLEKEYIYRNIDIRLQFAGDLPRISSDPGQLQQVFLNILTNAFAVVEDGGHVSITTCDEDAEFIGVSIQDNGCGMTAETQKHIFEPFFTTKKGYGTGLGLAITYGIVKKLGGDVKVQSAEGRGATFTVYLRKHPQMNQGQP
ncbi:ATP-binding protein [Thermodesulfobacteriota bacterium]